MHVNNVRRILDSGKEKEKKRRGGEGQLKSFFYTTIRKHREMQMTHGLAFHTDRLVGVARVAVMCPNRMWLEGKCKLERTPH